MAQKISQEEKRWRAESDAECLAQARIIQEDAGRLKAARQIAQERAAELEQRAKEMKAVAKKK